MAQRNIDQNKKPETLRLGWSVLWRYLLELKAEGVLLVVLGIISALAHGVVPYLVGRFFDALITPAYVSLTQTFAIQTSLAIIFLWGIVQIIVTSVDWQIDVRRRRIGTYLHALYPAQAVSRLVRLPIAFHKERKMGMVWDRITRAGNSLANIIEIVVIDLAPQFASVLVGVAISFTLNIYIASVIVFGLISYVITLFLIVRPMAKMQRTGNRAWNEGYGMAYDAVANTQTIKHANAEEDETKRVQKAMQKAARLWYKMEKLWSSVTLSQRIVVFGTQLAVFLFSFFLISKGNMTVGELIALNGYAGVVFGPFVMLGFNWQVVQNGIIAIERAEKILMTPEEAYEQVSGVSIGNIKGAISFEKATFRYKGNKTAVLKEINFSVHPGEKVALVGKSGAGKSTLIDLISGYYFPEKGSVRVDGIETKKWNLSALRKHIAIVPQEVVLFNDTIAQNIAYGKDIQNDKALARVAHEAHADVFIDSFPKKYKQIVGERGVKLSVGQKQRIAIARAIFRDPKILILDEPTSALDLESEAFITKSLERLMDGRTTIIIAHRLSTVRKADRILVIEDGHIVEEGKHEVLMEKEGGRYRYLYEHHIGLR